jgi:hypothetical protein
MLMNNMNDVCADLSRDADKSRIFLEEVQKLHKRLMSEDTQTNVNDANAIVLKDPPVIKKKKAKGKDASKEPESASLVPESTVNI